MLQSAKSGPAGAIGIAGAGRVGQAIGRILYETGEEVACVASRTPARAAAAAAFIGDGVRPVIYAELPRHASRILVCVADTGIESVAELWSDFRGTALHTCGARGPEALGILRERGAACGAMHPLQTVAEGWRGVAALRGAAYAISGDDAACAWAEQIAAAAKGRVIRVADEARPLYHAAAVMAGNYAIALVGAAEELLMAAGIGPAEALAALGPLVRQSVENALEAGPAAALTGPIERGDAATVRTHLRALRGASDDVRDLYCAGGRQALKMARRRGLSPARAEEIARAFEEQPEGNGTKR